MRLGAAIRAVRVRLRRRQLDVARAAGVSISTVSRIERGQLGPIALGTLLGVATALEMRIELVPRWRGGDLDRLLAAGHSAMHEQVARLLGTFPGWLSAPEVTFAVYGERGVIDVLAFHPVRRALLVIELKTQLIDVQALLGQVDRYRRLAGRIGRERRWAASSVGVWVVMRDTSTNRRRIKAHATVLSAALPDGIVQLRRWLNEPTGAIAAVTFLPDSRGRRGRQESATARRIRGPATGRAERGTGPTGGARAVRPPACCLALHRCKSDSGNALPAA